MGDPGPGDHLPPWRSVLAVVAHPDDECFGLGAVLAGFVDAGAAVAVLCFTHGESSTLHGVNGDLGSVRAAELAGAARVLGADPVRLVDYPDGALAEVDVDDLAAHVLDLAAAVEADGLLVFDTDGVTSHPDHARATLAALAAADRAGLAVLGWTVPRTVAAALNQEYGAAFTGHHPGYIDLVVTLYGQAPALPADAIGPKMARLRREHHRLLGNGYCTRPPELDCAFESICETCAFFQTSIEFRPTLQAQHDDAHAKGQTHRAGAVVHTDAAQAIGKIDVDVTDLHVDLLSIAGHKCYAPQGIGALYQHTSTPLEPVLRGAGQEHGLRPGTENVAGIVGLGVACDLARTHLAETARLACLRHTLWQLLNAAIPGLVRHTPEVSLPGTLTVSFPDVIGRDVLARAPGLAASTGSACHSGQDTPSATLLAMGVAPAPALGAVRLPLGRATTATATASATAILATAHTLATVR